MAITFTGTGPYNYDSTNGVNKYTTRATYSYSSGIITTTAAYADNILDFGVGLAELWIINAGANALCFQFPELYTPGTKDSGIVIGNSQIFFRHVQKRGMKIRSADLAAHTVCYVFGI